MNLTAMARGTAQTSKQIMQEGEQNYVQVKIIIMTGEANQLVS